jgi:glycosyltransferase involved in cell wall biosynthesis
MSLRIAIDAQLIPGQTQGIHTYLIGLIKALGGLEGSEQYVLVGPWEDPDWLKPFSAENQTIVRGPRGAGVRRLMGPLKPMINAVRRASSWVSRSDALWALSTKSDGFYDALNCAVLHFPYQRFVSSAIPTVFNPHDLQHVHYPQFFSDADYRWREATYSAACRLAHTVVVHSNFVKNDVVRHYQVAAEKVQVILTPPPTRVFAPPDADVLEAVKKTYRIQRGFALYPAMTWPHKNHLKLVEAMALLRDRGVDLDLIGTGRQTEFFREIQSRVAARRLEDRVRFLGIVPAGHLRALYRLSEFTVLPTLFEGAGLPLVEAWEEGSPVTCSGVTSLGEIASDAALLFDPESVESIADAMTRMAQDQPLRRRLAERGIERSHDFNWERTGKTYRAVYRRAAGRELTAEDKWLLGS